MMDFINANGKVILAVLLGLSEVLGMIPAIKANGIFQLVVNVLKKLKDVLTPAPKV